MGNSCQETPPLLLQDLKVTTHQASMIFPSKETHNHKNNNNNNNNSSNNKSLFLSNIDKVLNFDVETVHFFAANKDYPSSKVAQKLKDALEDALVAYEFLGGRMKMNSESGRLEIICNGEGAGFVVASCDYRLDEIGDLAFPNPAFAQFVHKSKDFLEHGDAPLCVAQITSCKCGGFVIGFTTSHTIFDGLSFKTFLDNLAALASNKPMPVTPSHDRHLLAARSPPRVTFPHPEMLDLGEFPTSAEAGVFEASSEELHFKVFHLTSDNINRLKEKAKDSNVNSRVTGFNVVTALLWRCKALSFSPTDPNRSSTILYAVDIRSRLSPPLPKSYAGNAVLTAYATAKCEALENGSFAKLVEMVTEGAKRMNDEYARSIIDWGELHNGFPSGEVLVSSWWRLGFEEVEYPWGKPRYCCPVVYHRKDIILLFPPIASSDGGDNGINIIVALPPKEMEKFKNLFYEFLI